MNQIPNPYPECYLYVRECRSGEEWIQPIHGDDWLDITHQIKRWIESEYGPDMQLDGKPMPGLDGDYYAQIKTDGRPPESVVCWDSGGFYLKHAGD